nr:MAG TPA: hypothetical protein [Caudoviricetes sp.]
MIGGRIKNSDREYMQVGQSAVEKIFFEWGGAV